MHSDVLDGRFRFGSNVCLLVRLTRAVLYGTVYGLILYPAVLPPAKAAELYDSDGVEIRWDTTLQYSVSVRLRSPAASLITPVNADDGDRNFASGLVSNRLDILSQIDLSYEDAGLHASADGWYDTVYHARTANTSTASYNPFGIPATAFAPAVRNLHGQYVELNDLFAFTNFNAGETSVSVRAGRQTVTWGESLFYDSGSIAAAQAPVDITKTYSNRSDYAANMFLPVTQISLTAQPSTAVSFSAYYQFEWRGDRQPGDGSYFSTSDYMGAGANRYLLNQDRYLLRDKDAVPSGGQYGAAIHANIGGITAGLYALHFNSKTPIVVVHIAPGDAPGSAGSYKLLYPGGSDLYGISLAGSADALNLAGEISLRRSAPLVAYTSVVTGHAGAAWVWDDNDFARGNTLDARLSATTTLPPAKLWDSADISGEAVVDDVIGVTTYAPTLSPAMDRLVAHIRALFVPHYYQVLPNLDLSLPLGIGRDMLGHTAAYAPYDGSNDISAGVKAVYRSVWKADITYTAFLGGADYQALADRDFLMARIGYSF
jgi:Protein of unknown function (DUF1302).